MLDHHDDHHRPEHHEAGDHADHQDHAHDDPPYQEDYFFATAQSVQRLTPSMTRIVLDVEGGERLVSTGRADEWIRLAFPPHENTPVTLPILMDNGKWGRPDGSSHCPNRPYTVRRWDANRHEMMIDIAAHEGGVAAEWALNAKAGDVVGICNPEGRYAPADDAKWVLLLTDITGLPAVGRIIEETPWDRRVIAHVEIPDEADRQELCGEGLFSVHWHEGHARNGVPTRLQEIARTIDTLPDGPGHIYIAGEAKAAAECRKHFRDALGFDKSRIDAIGYWILGQARV